MLPLTTAVLAKPLTLELKVSATDALKLSPATGLMSAVFRLTKLDKSMA